MPFGFKYVPIYFDDQSLISILLNKGKSFDVFHISKMIVYLSINLIFNSCYSLIKTTFFFLIYLRYELNYHSYKQIKC